MKIIVGLGNPGKEYEKSRHNAGFMVLDRIIKNCNAKFKIKRKLEADIVRVNYGNKEIILAKPQTFMNESGRAVRKIITNYKLQITNLYLIHDDLDLPLGKLRISQGRGSAGHKGVESIIQELGSKDFVRFRVGIKKIKNEKLKMKNYKDYVLGKFKGKERILFKQMIERCARAVLLALEKDINRAMSEFN